MNTIEPGQDIYIQAVKTRLWVQDVSTLKKRPGPEGPINPHVL